MIKFPKNREVVWENSYKLFKTLRISWKKFQVTKKIQGIVKIILKNGTCRKFYRENKNIEFLEKKKAFRESSPDRIRKSRICKKKFEV